MRLQNSVFILLFLGTGLLSAQDYLYQFGQWKQQSLTGSILVEGLYRSQENTLRSGFTEKPEMQKLNGRFKLNSGSVIWHPNFLQLNVQALYAPNIKNEQFLVLPERSETRTAEQLRINSYFFRQRPLSANLFANFQRSFVNRAYTTNVETRTKDYGAGLSVLNSVAPLNIRYTKNDRWQKELQSGRIYINKQEDFQIEANASFGKFDTHRLSYSYQNYLRSYVGNDKTRAYINNYRLQNNVKFGNEKKNSWRSFVFLRRQQGSYRHSRLQLNENFIYHLPAGFKMSALYSFSDFSRSGLGTIQSNGLLRAEHTLFLSLHSQAFFEYINTRNNSYNENVRQGGAGFAYNKKIPADGRITVAYNYRRRNEERRSQPTLLNIVNEKLNLADAQPAYLNNPDVIQTTVEVRNENSTVLYRLNIDYVLIERDAYLEIQRLPGGQISDGATVYVSYQTRQAFSYNYGLNNNTVRLALSLWKGFAEGYFRYFGQSYSDIINSDQNIFKTVQQQVYGLRISKSFITAGFEISNYNSNIIPYKAQRVYCRFTRNFGRRVRSTLNANWRNQRLSASNEKQQYADINARVSYAITMYSQVFSEGGYRFQNGRGIDLNLINWRAEYSTRFRQLYFSVGVEMYRRDYSGEKINYNGGYVRVERKF